MEKDYRGMSEAEAMSEMARLMWERYFKPRAIAELLNHSLDGYKAQVTVNNGDGTLTVQRPFDETERTLKCPPALAEAAAEGDQVLVVEMGDASNSFILCGADMSGFESGVQLGTVELTASWTYEAPYYYQTVTVTGAEISERSKVDLQPTAEQIAALGSAGVIGLMIENDDGTLTAYAIGAQTGAMTVQCTVTEVEG